MVSASHRLAHVHFEGPKRIAFSVATIYPNMNRNSLASIFNLTIRTLFVASLLLKPVAFVHAQHSYTTILIPRLFDVDISGINGSDIAASYCRFANGTEHGFIDQNRSLSTLD